MDLATETPCSQSNSQSPHKGRLLFTAHIQRFLAASCAQQTSGGVQGCCAASCWIAAMWSSSRPLMESGWPYRAEWKALERSGVPVSSRVTTCDQRWAESRAKLNRCSEANCIQANCTRAGRGTENRVQSKLHPRRHLRERKSCAGSTHDKAELGQRLAAPAGGLVEVQIHERASSPPDLRARICPQQQPSDQGEAVGTSRVWVAMRAYSRCPRSDRSALGRSAAAVG